jgi:curved DNA-binding protein CbpA
VSRDPYTVLGVRPDASSEELHDAYRRLVKLHHPDRNGGSADSARRFQEVQEAYDAVRSGKARPRSRPAASPPPRDHASVESRMADLERELRAARDAAREAIRDARGDRPSDEELGYYTTDDSFGKILADVRAEVSDRLADARKHPAVQRVADLVDGLDGLTSRFEGRDRDRGGSPGGGGRDERDPR